MGHPIETYIPQESRERVFVDIENNKIFKYRVIIDERQTLALGQVYAKVYERGGSNDVGVTWAPEEAAQMLLDSCRHESDHKRVEGYVKIEVTVADLSDQEIANYQDKKDDVYDIERVRKKQFKVAAGIFGWIGLEKDISSKEKRVFNFEEFFVDSEQQGRGLGLKMFEYLQQQIVVPKKIDEISLITINPEQAKGKASGASRFYERLGFNTQQELLVAAEASEVVNQFNDVFAINLREVNELEVDGNRYRIESLNYNPDYGFAICDMNGDEIGRIEGFPKIWADNTVMFIVNHLSVAEEVKNSRVLKHWLLAKTILSFFDQDKRITDIDKNLVVELAVNEKEIEDWKKIGFEEEQALIIMKVSASDLKEAISSIKADAGDLTEFKKLKPDSVKVSLRLARLLSKGRMFPKEILHKMNFDPNQPVMFDPQDATGRGFLQKVV